MSNIVRMPSLSPTMTHGKLARWLKVEGDTVSMGDMLAEIETDKATMEIEAVDEGILSKIVVTEGTEDIPVNTALAIIAEDDNETNDPEVIELLNSINSPEKIDSPSRVSNLTSNKKTNLKTPHTAQENETHQETSISSQTVREALRDAMAEEMRRDPDVFLMGEEVAQYQGAYKVSQGLMDEFGERRVIDTPITEYGFAHLGVGAAYAGLKPIIEFMTFNFAMQAIDAIVNSAAKTLYMSGGQMPVPIVFRGPNGAASRVGAQHSQDFASWYAHVPGLKVVSPYSAADAKGLLKAAIRDPNPVVFLENEILYGHTFDVPTEEYIVPLGEAKVIRPGNDVTIVAYSMAVAHALEASEVLSNKGIDAEVVDLRTLRPMDTETIIKSVYKTNRIVIAEEGWPVAGIGAEIAAVVSENAFDYLDAPIKRVSARDVPLPYAANLEAMALPKSSDIVKAVEAVCYR